MQYAITKNQKSEAFPKGRGNCICCSKEVIAKCGQIKVWHWAHSKSKNCDGWFEPATEWHHDWKSRVPKAWQEVVQFDPSNGEKHIADVKTEEDIVIEFQNSPISEEELFSRKVMKEKHLYLSF